jgi:hypothetical protein
MKRAWLLCVALAGCGEPSGDARPGASAQPAASPSAVPSASVAAVPSVTASSSASAPLVLRPPGATASREEREKAAKELLSGRARAAELPLVAVDPGEELEPWLRAAISNPMEIRLGAVVVTDLDEKEVRAALELERAKMRFRICYAGGLRSNPNLQGRISGRVTVKGAGRPSAVEEGGSDMPDKDVARCLLEALGKVDFPAPRGPAAQAVVTLTFSP